MKNMYSKLVFFVILIIINCNSIFSQNVDMDKDYSTWVSLVDNTIYKISITNDKVYLINKNNEKKIFDRIFEKIDLLRQKLGVGNEPLYQKYVSGTSEGEGANVEYIYIKSEDELVHYDATLIARGYFLSVSENHTNMVRDLSGQLELVANKFMENNLTFRYTYNYGNIGTDLIPPYYGSYNAGRKFYIEGIEVQEKKDVTYVTKGGYSVDVNGYKFIYQFINPSISYYLINYSITGTSKMSDVVKAGFFSFKDYKTNFEYQNFEFSNTYILKPNSTYKDNIIVGITKSPNIQFKKLTITKLDPSWYSGLRKAITSRDTLMSLMYLNDNLAIPWKDSISYNLASTRKYFKEKAESEGMAKYKSYVTASVKPTSELTYDPDFESEVIITIRNKSVDKLSVLCYTPFGQISTFVNAQSTVEIKKNIKGINKENLYIEIKSIKKTL